MKTVTLVMATIFLLPLVSNAASDCKSAIVALERAKELAGEPSGRLHFIRDHNIDVSDGQAEAWAIEDYASGQSANAADLAAEKNCAEKISAQNPQMDTNCDQAINALGIFEGARGELIGRRQILASDFNIEVTALDSKTWTEQEAEIKQEISKYEGLISNVCINKGNN